MCLNGMRDHGFTVKGGEVAACDPTEHGHPEMKADVIVECFVASGMVIAEGAESGIYRSRVRAPIYGDALLSSHLVHGDLQ